MIVQILTSPVTFAALFLVPGLLLLIALIEVAFPGRLPQALVNLLSSILNVSDSLGTKLLL
jgi:hypothetical protein